MSIASVFHGILIGCMMLLAVLTIVAIIRSILGPKVADRIIAVNMIGTLVMAMIAILTIVLEEDYLADVCLVYAMISFLTVVVLTKVYSGIYLEKKGIRDEQEALKANVETLEKEAE